MTLRKARGTVEMPASGPKELEALRGSDRHTDGWVEREGRGLVGWEVIKNLE